MKVSVLLADPIERMEAIQEDEPLLAFARLSKKYGAHWSQISTLLYEELDRDDRQCLVTWVLKRWDTEGAEVPALKGAIKTIRHFRWRMARCLCQKWVRLTHGWEAVLLAEPVAAGANA
ncbi:hypothetical protein D3C84_384830 [compost metagenome]